MANYTNNREVLTAISKGTMDEEIMGWAVSQIEKMDARNAKRTSKPSKTAIANAPIKEALVKYLTENDGKFTEMELGTALEVTHNKAGSLARQLVKENIVKTEEVKIPKVGTRKVYFIEK